MKKQQTLTGIGVISAIAASLCCITPLLAMLASVGGIASSVSWIEPLRPWLIGFAFITLGIAWYFKLKPQTIDPDDCGCDEDVKPSFWNSKSFLAIVTVFALIMISFPMYAHIFYPKATSQNISIAAENKVIMEFDISGMTCRGCENHIGSSLKESKGVSEAVASFREKKATVTFDKTITNSETLRKIIEENEAYKVKTYTEIQ